MSDPVPPRAARRGARAVARLVAAPRSLAHAALEILLPADCLLCGGWLPWRQRGGVCPACWETLPWAPGLRLRTRGPLVALVWAGDYGGPLRRLVQALKFERFDPCGAPLGAAAAPHLRRLAAAAAARRGAPSPAIVVPVPLHWTRRWRRGFNQSLLLAQGIAGATGLPLVPGLLVRRRRGRRQLGLRRHERLASLAGVFAARPAARAGGVRVALRGRSVLLVDDVATTGATLEACAAALVARGAAAVIGCAVARTPRGRP